MRKEIWKEYPIEVEHEGDYRLEFSSFGRVRTYNALHPEGKIINGGRQGGFPIIRLRLFKERSQADQSKIDKIQSEIDQLNTEIKALMYSPEEMEKKVDLRKIRDELIQKRKRLNKRINNKRCANLAILVHKAIAELFIEKPETDEKLFVIHLDFDKENNNVENLKYATQEELNERTKKHPKNVLYAFRKQFLGERHNTNTAKLTETEVLTIKKRLKKGYTLKRLAKQFNVSDMQIHRIKTGENWGHVKLIEDILEEKENKNQ